MNRIYTTHGTVSIVLNRALHNEMRGFVPHPCGIGRKKKAMPRMA